MYSKTKQNCLQSECGGGACDWQNHLNQPRLQQWSFANYFVTFLARWSHGGMDQQGRVKKIKICADVQILPFGWTALNLNAHCRTISGRSGKKGPQQHSGASVGEHRHVHNQARCLNGIASRAQWAEYVHADVWQSLVLIVGCWVRMCQRECCGMIYEPAFPPCFCLGFTQFYNWQDGTRRISISWRELSLRLCILLNAKLVWRIVIRSGAG